MDPFERPEYTLKTAKAKIDHLYWMVVRFSETSEHRFFSEPDFQTRVDSVRVEILTGIPTEVWDKFSGIMADLKHSLDQAVNAAYTAQTGEISESIHFPVGLTEADFKKEVTRRCRKTGLDGAIIAAIEETNAFEDGNPTLHALSVFARNKHRNFLKVAPLINSDGISGNFSVEHIAIRTVPLGDDKTFEIAQAKGVHGQLNIHMAVRIGVGEPGHFFGKDAVEAARECLFETALTFGKIKGASIAARLEK